MYSASSPTPTKTCWCRSCWICPSRASTWSRSSASRCPARASAHALFIKVQDGCDNHCTFCITTLARGAGRSRPLERRSWPTCSSAGDARRGRAHRRAPGLVGAGPGPATSPAPPGAKPSWSAPPLPRLRLSSLEPWDLDAGFLRRCGKTRACAATCTCRCNPAAPPRCAAWPQDHARRHSPAWWRPPGSRCPMSPSPPT